MFSINTGHEYLCCPLPLREACSKRFSFTEKPLLGGICSDDKLGQGFPRARNDQNET